MRRRPEETALYRAVQRHLASFVERAEDRGRAVPGFVRRQRSQPWPARGPPELSGASDIDDQRWPDDEREATSDDAA